MTPTTPTGKLRQNATAQQLLAEMAASPAAFRARLLIDTDRGLQRLGETLDQHQATDFAALDSDQAKMLRNAMERLVRANPWLANLMEVQRLEAVNRETGSKLTVLANDAPSSYGLTPDAILIDEITHWGARDLWDSLVSAAAKRRHCLLVVITNAGTGRGSSWQWNAREFARESARGISRAPTSQPPGSRPSYWTSNADCSRRPRSNDFG